MANGARRAFRPELNGYRLEDRMVLSVAAVAQPAAAVVTATTGDPLVAVTPLSTKIGFINTTLNQLNSAYQTFAHQYNQACQKVVLALGNGSNSADLLASLKAYTTLEGGVLESRLQRISRRLPGGENYLYNPTVANPPAPPGPTDIRNFAPSAQRLKTQADALLAYLDANATTIQQACSKDTIPTILQTAHNSRTTTQQFIKSELLNGQLVVNGYVFPTG